MLPIADTDRTTTECSKKTEKRVPVGGAFLPNACSLAPPKRAQLRAPLSPLQTAWTGFDPNLYSGGSSSAGPALVERATARSFILTGALWLTQCLPHPWSQDGEQCIPLHQGCCQPGRCPADGLSGLWGLTVKAQCLSACLPPRHPNSLWLSYRPRVVGIGFSQTKREWC